MKLRFKLMISLLALYLSQIFASLFYVFYLTNSIVPSSVESVQQLSMGILNETFQFETKALLQAYKINQTLIFMSAFMIRDMLISQRGDIGLLANPESLTIFLQPLLHLDKLERFSIVCMNGSQQHFGNSSGGQYIPWTNQYQAYLSIFNGTNLVQTIGNENCNIQINYCVTHFINNALTSSNFMKNQVRSRSILLDGYPIKIIWENYNRTTLSDILDCNDMDVNEILQFRDKFDTFGCLKQEPQTICHISRFYQLIKYIQFSFYDSNYYCQQEAISKFTYMTVLSSSQYKHDLGTDHLKYDYLYLNIYFNLFIIIILTAYVYRIAVKVALSFEVPITMLSELLVEPHKYHPEDKKQRIMLQDQLNSKELLNIYDQVLMCITMYQFYSHQKFLYDQDLGAEYLQALCQIKSFYKSCSNKWMMSICGNNIAQIHYKNKRYNEALNQLAESIMIANQELTSLKQIEKLRKKCELNHLQATIFRRLQSYIINKFAGKSSHIIDQTKYTETQNRIHKSTPLKTLLQQVSVEENMKNNSKQITYRQNYKNDKQQLRLCLFFRKYQYVQVLFKYCMNADSKLYNETIENIKLLDEEICSNKQFKNCRYLSVLRIRILIKLFYCYKNLKRHAQANMTYLELIELYDKYLGLLDIKMKYQLGINIFERVTTEQITAQLNVVKIIQLKDSNQDHEAAIECLHLLKSSQANTKIGKFILNILSIIIAKHHLDESCLEQLQMQMAMINQKIILLIDYSNEISFDQLRVAQSLCKHILKTIHKNSQIGLYVFNEGLFEIFSLQDTSKNPSLFVQMLEQQILPTGGKSQLYDAIIKSMQVANCDNISNNYICLFSECQIEISLNRFYELKQQLDLQRFTLVLVQIQNSNKNIHLAEELCNYCNGILIQNEKEFIEWLDTLNSVHSFHNKYTEFL